MGLSGFSFTCRTTTIANWGAIRAWAFGETPVLTGIVNFGYSSTVPFVWQNVANIYDTTPCFVTQSVTIDTGNVSAGSLEALGIYLHSLGDNWSHQECIAAADAEGKPFAAHVKLTDVNDPLLPCSWLMHEVEFGDFSSSNRTYSGTLAIYQQLTAFAQQSNRPIYRPIPVNAEGNHLSDAMYNLVHTSDASHPAPRRVIANQLREWSLQTRGTKSVYWLFRVFTPVTLK